MVAATKAEIARWFDQGVEFGATHMAVLCDDWDHEDMPDFIELVVGPEAKDLEFKINFPMSRAGNVRDYLTWRLAQNQHLLLMEVYDLRGDKAAQMAELRAMHW